MDTSETYIKMRKKAVFDLPAKSMYGLNPHHYYGDVYVDARGSFFIRFNGAALACLWNVRGI